MIGAVILTFIVTALSMLVLFLLDGNKKQTAEKRHLMKENDGLRRQLSDYSATEQRRKECAAYDRGLYDGRATDTLYRNVLKRYSSKDQVDVMMNGESEG